MVLVPMWQISLSTYALTIMHLTQRSVESQQAQLVNMVKYVKLLMITNTLVLLHLRVRLNSILLWLISFLENVLVLGSWSQPNKKAELLDANHDLWAVISDYPFEQGLIFFFHFYISGFSCKLIIPRKLIVLTSGTKILSLWLLYL